MKVVSVIVKSQNASNCTVIALQLANFARIANAKIAKTLRCMRQLEITPFNHSKRKIPLRFSLKYKKSMSKVANALSPFA